MGLVVPVGFVAIFTGWGWVARIAGGLLWASQKVVWYHANLEPNWRIPSPPVWLGIALAAALISAAIWRARWSVPPVALLLALLLWAPPSRPMSAAASWS